MESIQDLVQELERQKNNSRDLIVDTSIVEMKPVPDEQVRLEALGGQIVNMSTKALEAVVA